MAKQQNVFLVTNGSGYLSGFTDYGLPVWGYHEFNLFDEEDARRYAEDNNGTVVRATLTLRDEDVQ